MDMNSGIYIIRNIINGKFYIGSSKDLINRWKHHKFYLNNAKHPNKHLQHAWTKYGSDNFEFDVLHYEQPEYLLSLEQIYLDRFSKVEWCYNIAQSSTAPGLGRTPSKETRQLMSKLMSGRLRTQSHKDNLSRALMGNKISDETKSKISKSLKGKIESNETKLKKSLSWQGKTNNPHAKLVESDVKNILVSYNQHKSDRFYKMALSKEYDVSWNTIHRIVTRQIWKHIEV